MSKLVIVESPSKAKTIQKYLGRVYTVMASTGHVCVLPKSKIGNLLTKLRKKKLIDNNSKGVFSEWFRVWQFKSNLRAI